MSNNHVGGGVHEPTKKTMAFYDALPPAMREVLRNAFFNYATGQALRALRKALRNGSREDRYVDLWCDEFIRGDATAITTTGRRQWADPKLHVAAQKPRRRRDWHDAPLKMKARP